MLINKKIIKIIILSIAVIVSGSFIYGESDKIENSRVYLGKEFYSALGAVVFFQRDSYLDSILKKPVSARAILQTIDRKEKKNYRAVFSDEDSIKYGFKIFYYLYFSDSDFISLMKEGELYFFKGKILVWTPLDSQKKEFIFDISLEEISREKK